ncbi:uncharacterized protein LOC105232792 [Bactrocera dorsalis]|uniref:Uncharacterized protein LOC105232792 n=1 Tax=Bactrocera dorsalis TaxID=27457 RepID=A0A034WHJ5_BACDO|nr:uncharacterized protein LOC105232792 [Bactrocera dorsalis]
MNLINKYPIGMVQYMFLLIGVMCLNGKVTEAEIEENTINGDGSFSFRHSNDDIGSFYHSASSSPDNIVQGRYGARNPSTGQLEEVVYTAGPRGFRVNGPKIHRKMNLAQYPVREVGTVDDPLADPYDDPSYSFNFRSEQQSRTETSDSSGRIRGLYSYLDDVGERHSVRYAAGAGTGYEVLNSVPDNPASVAYAAPLYKAHSKARGKMTTQRGPNGTYKLIAAGPDHRRAESRSPDGFVKGTYSYLDDAGIQRTVEYIAGPGIGYRIVKNRMGPGSHINPSLTEFRLRDTDFKLSNDFGVGVGGSSSIDGFGAESVSKNVPNKVNGDRRLENTPKYNAKESKINNKDNVDSVLKVGIRNQMKSDRMGAASNSRGTTRYGMIDGERRGGGYDYSLSRKQNVNRNKNHNISSENRVSFHDSQPNLTLSSSTRSNNRDHGGVNIGKDYNYVLPHSSSGLLGFNDDDLVSLPPLITNSHKILQLEREKDWTQRHRDSTVIQNVGKWYIGLPPGHSVRAHVQNIDLLPLGGRRVPSPSEALRQDEIADIMTSMESGVSYGS